MRPESRSSRCPSASFGNAAARRLLLQAELVALDVLHDVVALAPLLELGLDWDDYPEEPVPIDCTILHALERLIPFVAAKAGYRFATTHIKGVNR